MVVSLPGKLGTITHPEIEAPSAQRQAYLEWLSTWQKVPYEWGGEGYCGKDSNEQWMGGGGGYEGYGIDCSGLVSCGAWRADYDWDESPRPAAPRLPWRRVTSDMSVVSDPVPNTDPPQPFGWMYNLIPGDIINKPRHHVVTYLWQEGVTPMRIFHTIEGYGQNTVFEPLEDNQTRQRPRTEDYLNDPCDHDPPHYYEGRVLKQF